MRRPLGVAVALAGVTGGWIGSVFGSVTFDCIPDNSAPDGNDVVRVDCFLQTDTAFTLNSYQLTYPCAGALQGGASGSLDHLVIPGLPCTFAGADPDCYVDGFQAICTGSTVCFTSAQCGGNPCLEDPSNPGVRYCLNSGSCADSSPFVDTLRDDYVFRGVADFTSQVGTDICPGTLPFVGGSAPAGTGASLTPGPGKYAGSFRYRASDCAVGSFSLDVVGNGNPPNAGNATRALNTSGTAQLVLGSATTITVDTGLCCTNGSTCTGDFNPFCCRNVQGGLLSKPESTCLPPLPGTCTCTDNSHCEDYDACTNNVCAPMNPLSDAVGCVYSNNIPAGFCCDPLGIQPLDVIDDDNPCTVDSCEGGVYPAVHDAGAANGNFCPDDGNICTVDTCVNGVCNHSATAANGNTCTEDGNLCTVDFCSNGTCVHSASMANGLGCQGDGVFCTYDVCNAGVCTHPNINTLPCQQLTDCPPNASSCTGSVGNPGLCVCTPPAGPCYGDVYPSPSGDGICDLADILCAIDGFGNPALCPQADIAPCEGDGEIDVSDILGVLDGFAGTANCLHPCG
jgi:hypothetical protein